MSEGRAAAALAILLGAVVAAVVLAGGGGGKSAPSTAGGWIVRSGTPLSVAAENRLAGTGAWQLPVSAARTRSLAAYVSSQSARPGDRERVYVDAPGSAWAEVDIYRMGWYGGRGGRLVLRSGHLATVRQPPCTHSDASGLTECRWRALLDLRLPRSLTSGVYVVKVSDTRGEQRDALFVLEGHRPAPLVAQIPIATYEAYNNWGGSGLYPGYRRVRATGTTQGVEASFDRPYDSATGAGQFFKGDVAMVRFLEQRGYPLSYTTSVSLDRGPARVRGARALIDVGHSEYWSQGARDAFTRALAGGTSLIFMSSDTLAWRVRYAPATAASSEASAPDHRIVGYKEFAARDSSRPTSGAFPDLGAGLTGSAFNRCITPSLRPGIYRYYAWRPALTPDWLYRGSGFAAGSSVPGIVGYETDSRTPATPPGTVTVGSGAATCRGVLAAASAETTLYRARSGALVFATGTLGWQYALSPLPAVSPDTPRRPDARLARLTDNLIRRALAGR